MSAISLFPTLAKPVQISGPCFDEATTALIGGVFDQICKALATNHSDAVTRDIIAKRIICLAGRGERDPEKMGSEALICLGLKPNRFTINTQHHHPWGGRGTGETALVSETVQILAAIEAIIDAIHQEWRQLATETLTKSERNERLLALDDRASKLLELLERKWKFDEKADSPDHLLVEPSPETSTS
jgi:hypothetical protein